MARMIYADNAATTRVKPRVLEAMKPYFTEEYGNPSSLYGFSRTAKLAIEEARAKVAALLEASPEEIYFTGGGTESDNWALKGAALAFEGKGRHIITTEIEHPAVLRTCEFLQKQGFEITYLKVDSDGLITARQVEKAIRKDTILISVMFANNEIGAIMPVFEIGEVARAHKIPFHTDAVQAAGHVPIDVSDQNIDLLALSGHKFGAPKGIGALYIRRGVRIEPLLHGGGHERGKRSGTENVPYIVGLGAAADMARKSMEENILRVSAMRDYIIDEALKLPYAKLTGPRENRLPGIASFVFEAIEGEALLLSMYNKGVCASSGSACSSGALDPSHVLLAIGLPHHVAHGSLRLSLGEENTEEEAREIARALHDVVCYLRDMSPMWENGRPAWV